MTIKYWQNKKNVYHLSRKKREETEQELTAVFNKDLSNIVEKVKKRGVLDLK